MTDFSLGCFLQSDLDSLHVLRTTPARNVTCCHCYVLFSIDGLLVLKPFGGRWEVMLWNPSIRKTLTLPPPPGISTQLRYRDFGFGFDPSVQDFKLVRLVYANSQTGVKSVAIYTLGANSWKSVEFQGDCSKQLSSGIIMISVPLNGVIYTLARDVNFYPMDMISFDLRSEVFSSFAWPASIGPVPDMLATVDQGRTLAVVSLTEPDSSVWVLERLGDNTKSWSWIRRYSFVTQADAVASGLYFLCMKKNGEMLLEWKNMVVCHNLETQQEKLMLDKNTKSFIDGRALPYMESLILHQ